MEARDRKPTKIPEKYRSVVLFLRDAGIAIAVVACVLVGMFAYTGLWPPLVVVESNSMQHDDDSSAIGVIDTGDLVLVKKVDSVSDVETYLDGVVSGHRTYGDYGDVIIYKRQGQEAYTPIIHRAIVYLEANEGSDSYRVPALRLVPSDMWSASNPTDTWDHLTSTLTIFHVGSDQNPSFREITVVVSISSFISEFRGNADGLPSGYITMGDHNFQTDQQSASNGLRPVDIDWIVGKARGEIPWFGLLKLWVTDSLGSDAPANSVRNLWISIALIVLAPISVDVALTYREKQGIAKKHRQAEKAEEKVDAEEGEEPPDDSPGAASRSDDSEQGSLEP